MNMRAAVLYRTAAVLLVLFSAGHTLGFRKTDPRWGVDSLIDSIRSVHFRTQGFNRTYWDFHVGFGFLVSVFFLFAAILAWQLGGLPANTLATALCCEILAHSLFLPCGQCGSTQRATCEDR